MPCIHDVSMLVQCPLCTAQRALEEKTKPMVRTIVCPDCMAKIDVTITDGKITAVVHMKHAS